MKGENIQRTLFQLLWNCGVMFSVLIQFYNNKVLLEYVYSVCFILRHL